MVVPGVRQLVMAAAELPRLRSMTAGEWRTHVKALASPKPTDEKSSKAAGEGERR
jgi:hypothetical protein